MLTLYQENNIKNLELCLDSTSKPKLSLDFISRQITLQENRRMRVFLPFEALLCPRGWFLLKTTDFDFYILLVFLHL